MRKTLAILLLALALPAAAASAGGTAEGALVIDGRSVALAYAYVTEPSTLEVDLSNVPLDRSRIKRLTEELPPGVVVLTIQVRESDRRATSVTIRGAGLPSDGLRPDRVGIFTAETIRNDLVVATLERAKPVSAGGHELTWSVRFRALPPDAGAVRNLDDALDRSPRARRLLDRANDLLGGYAYPAALCLFLGLVAIALVWGKVLAPRRARRILSGLSVQGYAEVDVASPDLVSALDAAAPFALEPSVRFPELPRETLQAVARSAPGGRRYVTNVFQRWQDMRSVGSGLSKYMPLWQTLVVESAPLAIEGELCIRPRDLRLVSAEREARFGFRPATIPDLLPAFVERYVVFGRSAEITLPRELQQAFVSLESALLTDLHGAFPNTRFGPRGWGICASDVWLDERRLRALLEAADRISAAARSF